MLRRWLLIGVVSAGVVMAGCSGSGDGDGDGGGSVTDVAQRSFSFQLPLFAANSAWNQKADSASVLAGSDQQILVTYRVLRGDTTSLMPAGESAPTTWPFADVTNDDYSVPIWAAGTGQQSISICDYEGVRSWAGPEFPGDQELGGPESIPAGSGTIRPSGPQGTDSDGHLILYDIQNHTEYDFWQATTQRSGPCRSLGGGLTGTSILEAGAADFFDVQGGGVSADGLSSARATGVPLLAGLILPEDVASGAIAHALAFSIPGPRNTASDPFSPKSGDYFYPCSTAETDYYNKNANALASGQRIRLKQTIVGEDGSVIDETTLAPITRMFLAALRTYGGIVCDAAGGFTFYAEDVHSANLNLTDDQVNTLTGRAAGTAIGTGQTKWLVVMEKLNDDLATIPFAHGPWQDGQSASSAGVSAANFEVVQPAGVP